MNGEWKSGNPHANNIVVIIFLNRDSCSAFGKRNFTVMKQCKLHFFWVELAWREFFWKMSSVPKLPLGEPCEIWENASKCQFALNGEWKSGNPHVNNSLVIIF